MHFFLSHVYRAVRGAGSPAPLRPGHAAGPRLAALLTIACCTVAACGGADVSATGDGGGGSAGAGAAPGHGAELISFDAGETILISPGAERSVGLRVEPPGAYKLRLTLNGDALDAALSTTDLTTQDDGRAEIRLTAATMPTEFALRASIGSSTSAELKVVISSAGLTTVEVSPQYAGKRAVTEWTASARPGSTCDEVGSSFDDPSELSATVPYGELPTIGNVPVGPVLAVTVRAGRFAVGCTEVTGLTPDETHVVSVAVSDRPLRLDNTELNIELGLDSDKEGWPSITQSAVTAALKPLEAGDAGTLLDAMAGGINAPADFTGVRQQSNWDAAATAHFSAQGAQSIRAIAQDWMVRGLSTMTGPAVIRGTLSSTGLSVGKATLQLDAVGTASSSEAGFPGTTLVNWTAQPDDTVHLGGAMFWLPSRFVAAAARTAAVQDYPGAQTVPDALAEAISCSTLGASLSGSTAPAIAGCDHECVAELCSAALRSLWTAAANASLQAPALLEVTAAGDAAVSEDATPVGFTGTWVGALASDAESLSVGGIANASTEMPGSAEQAD